MPLTWQCLSEFDGIRLDSESPKSHLIYKLIRPDFSVIAALIHVIFEIMEGFKLVFVTSSLKAIGSGSTP